MASEEINDDILSQFLAFSGSSDPSVARQYLEMSGNNLEMAVSLFMDHSGAGAGGSGGAGGMGGGMGAAGFGSPEIRAPDATRSMRLVGGIDPPRGGAMGGMGGGGMGMGMGGEEPSAALMAAIGGPAAREMMRNMMAAENGIMGGGGGGGVGMGSTWASASVGGAGGPDFRDPSNRSSSSRRNRSGSGGTGGDGGNARRGSNRRPNNNASDDDDDDDVQVVDADGQAMDEDNDEEEYNYDDSSDDDSHDLGGTANARGRNVNANPPSLSTMFAQPTHLMHRAGGFMGAKNFAKDARRWLLVNIQSDDDFACHALNRDVWRDELVENLVREGFILWQAMSSSNEGQTYITRYKVQGYPHIAIIDPRTGSLLWRKEGWTQVNPLSADQFVEIASDFCSRHSFDKLPTAARNAYTNGIPLGAAASNDVSSDKSGNKRPIHELTEDEQLQAAIRASMQADAMDDDDDDVQVVDGGNDDQKPSANEEDNDATNIDESDDEPKPSAFEQEILTMEVGDEPSGGSVARVQIRMPDGKRLVRKFPGDCPVKTIYAFVAQNNEEAKGGRAFELKAKFPPQDLLVNAEDTVVACGLNGEAINVIWK